MLLKISYILPTLLHSTANWFHLNDFSFSNNLFIISCNTRTYKSRTQCKVLSLRSFRVHIGAKSSGIYSIKADCPQAACHLSYMTYTFDSPKINFCETSICADDTAILCSDILASDGITKLEKGLRELQVAAIGNSFRSFAVIRSEPVAFLDLC